MADRNLYNKREIGMTYEDAVNLIKENPLVFDDLPVSYQTDELRKIANTQTMARAYDKYIDYKENPGKFKQIVENMKNKKSQFKTGSSDGDDGVESAEEDADFIVNSFKDSNKLEELKKAIEKAEGR